MNEQVDKVQACLLANKLSVHYVDKSMYMLVNSNNNIRVADGNFELKMANHVLARTKTYKYLGLRGGGPSEFRISRVLTCKLHNSLILHPYDPILVLK